MVRVAIVGAGTSGLFGALLLANDGHDVTVVEKDARPAAVEPSTVADWHRPGTPQAMLPHGLMGLGRALLRAHTPAVLDRILAMGAVEFALAPFVPGGQLTAEDDELVVVFCRRPLLETALWDAVVRDARIDLRTATTVTGLAAGPTLVTDRGEVRCDLVIDAGGRRSPLQKWTGANAADAAVEDCKMIYYSRYFRLLAGAELPRGPWLWGPRAELPFALAIVHLADRGVHSITFGVPTFDSELKALRDSRAFAAGCALLPAFAPWCDPSRTEPISEVLAMGGLQNVLRPFPLSSSVLPIGDALCHTNAAYGWGITCGLAHASALAATLRDHTEIDAVGAAYHARVWPEARARWELSVEQDRARVQGWRGLPPAATDARAAALRALMPAAMLDARVFRAVMRASLLIDPADGLLDAELFASAKSAIERRGAAPPPPASPTRAQFLAALA